MFQQNNLESTDTSKRKIEKEKKEEGKGKKKILLEFS